MTACGKPFGLPQSLGNRGRDSHISTARRLLHSHSNQLRKEALLSCQPYLFSRLILQLEKTTGPEPVFRRSNTTDETLLLLIVSLDNGMAQRVLLYVEDDDAAFLTMQLALREFQAAIELHRAADGEQALAFVRKKAPHEDAPRPSLILLDLNLPKKSGI